MGAPNSKRKSEVSIGSNPFPGIIEKKNSSHSSKKKVNIEINVPSKKAPPVPIHGHQPIKHFQTANYGQKIDLGSFVQPSESKVGVNELLSKVSRSPSGSEDENQKNLSIVTNPSNITGRKQPARNRRPTLKV